MEEWNKFLEKLKAECFDWARLYESAQIEISEQQKIAAIARNRVEYLTKQIESIELEMKIEVHANKLRVEHFEAYDERTERLLLNPAFRQYQEKNRNESSG